MHVISTIDLICTSNPQQNQIFNVYNIISLDQLSKIKPSFYFSACEEFCNSVILSSFLYEEIKVGFLTIELYTLVNTQS